MSVAATARLEEARSRRVATDLGLLSGTEDQLNSSSWRGGDILLTTSVTVILPSLSILISCFLVSN